MTSMPVGLVQQPECPAYQQQVPRICTNSKASQWLTPATQKNSMVPVNVQLVLRLQER